MRGLDPYDYVFVFGCHRRDLFGLEVAADLFGDVRHHSQTGDIDQSQHARANAVDDGAPESFEIAPTGAAGVDHGGDAGAKAERVRLHAVVASPRVLDPGGMEQVRVDVDDAGRDVQAGYVDCLPGA